MGNLGQKFCIAGIAQVDQTANNWPIMTKKNHINNANFSAENYPALSSVEFDSRFERAFGLLAFVANRFMLNHMRRICIELEMDLETALVWGTLAQMNVLSTIPMNANPMVVLDDLGLQRDQELKPLRLADLTQITGLPRETVRRKLEKLATTGRVSKTDGNRWVYVREAIGELERQFTKQSVLNLLATANTLCQLLSSVDFDPQTQVETNVATDVTLGEHSQDSKSITPRHR